MTIRFSKGGTWYKLGDKLPGGVNALLLTHRRNGSYYAYPGPQYDKNTGILTNNGDAVLMGMYLGGVLHPFITLDNSRTRGALPTPVHVSRGGVPSYANPTAYAIITESIIFKKVDENTWTSEKTLNYLEKTIVAGASSDFVGNLVFRREFVEYNVFRWLFDTSPQSGLLWMVNNEVRLFGTEEADLADYLIKVIA